ncbi:MAG: nucleotidyltransferase [Clostridia bacterium]|nr:nucleotidyltransferase [Clostridia bacterium]
MNQTTLVVMAAGLGSRYGGLKQIDPIGPSGEIIIDYSVYDAVKAGFSKVVFIIKKENEEIFRELIGNKLEKIVDVDYAFQSVDDIPGGNIYGREKPWGTGHAVLAAKPFVKTPFAVINADDFYGKSTYTGLQEFLANVSDNDRYQYAMMGFILENTLTDNGSVARGICEVSADGFLKQITERTKIQKFEDATKFEENGIWTPIPKGSFVSMNTWGFTTSIFDELEARFPKFLEESQSNILKAEYFLPSVVDALIQEKKADVRVVPCQEKWYGVTYKEDKQPVMEAIQKMVDSGIYPAKLWN